MVNDVFGTDIDSTWSFVDGDLELSKDKGNIGQAIQNRLMTDDDQYTQFYIQYGGRLYEHLGDLNHSTIHEYIRIEIEHILEQEPRIQEIMECTVNKTSNREVECNLKIKPVGSDEVIPLNLVINDDGGVFINSSELNGMRV